MAQPTVKQMRKLLAEVDGLSIDRLNAIFHMSGYLDTDFLQFSVCDTLQVTHTSISVPVKVRFYDDQEGELVWGTVYLIWKDGVVQGEF